MNFNGFIKFSTLPWSDGYPVYAEAFSLLALIQFGVLVITTARVTKRLFPGYRYWITAFCLDINPDDF